jgi:hypothetical protein
MIDYATPQLAISLNLSMCLISINPGTRECNFQLKAELS